MPSTGLDTIVDSITVGPFQENAHFLRRVDSDEVIVFDPGDEAERLIGWVDEQGLKPVAVVNTHAHLDHIGAVAEFRRRFEIPFYLHSLETPLLEGSPEHAMMFGLPAPEVPEVDHDLDGLDRLTLAGIELELRLTPGHSPGSVTFLLPGRIISGDVLFAGSIGRSDLPGGDGEQLLRSIHDQILPLPDETIVHSGHGPDTTVGRERQSNPFLVGM